MQIGISDFEIKQDAILGETSEHPMNGPSRMLSYNNQYLIVGGGMKDASYDDIPRGGAFSFDKSDLRKVHATSPLSYKSLPYWNP